MNPKDTERHVDLMDQAAAASETFLDADLKNHRARAAEEPNSAFDGEHCVEPDCGIEIPRERLKLGYQRCVDCANRREQLSRQVQRFGYGE